MSVGTTISVSTIAIVLGMVAAGMVWTVWGLLANMSARKAKTAESANRQKPPSEKAL